MVSGGVVSGGAGPRVYAGLVTGAGSEVVLTSKVCGPSVELWAFVTVTLSTSLPPVTVLPALRTTVVPLLEFTPAPMLRFWVTSKTMNVAPVKVPAGPVRVILPGKISWPVESGLERHRVGHAACTRSGARGNDRDLADRLWCGQGVGGAGDGGGVGGGGDVDRVRPGCGVVRPGYRHAQLVVSSRDGAAGVEDDGGSVVGVHAGADVAVLGDVEDDERGAGEGARWAGEGDLAREDQLAGGAGGEQDVVGHAGRAGGGCGGADGDGRDRLRGGEGVGGAGDGGGLGGGGDVDRVRPGCGVVRPGYRHAQLVVSCP